MTNHPWLLVILFALITSCGRSPVAPSAPVVVPALLMTGEWAGTYIAVCPGISSCASVVPPSGPQRVALALEQSGESLSGQITLWDWLLVSAPVTGTVSQDGGMTLQGIETWPAAPLCRPPGEWRISAWNARYDRSTDSLMGDFTFVTQKRFSSCSYIQELTVRATNLSLRRGTMDVPAFDGHWQGTYDVTCTAEGRAVCDSSDAGGAGFDLALTQSGAGVTGTLTSVPPTARIPLPVAGAIGGDGVSIVLVGERRESISGGEQVVRVTSWSTRKDAAGRLTGSFSYRVDVLGALAPHSRTYEATLRRVVRVPW